MMYQNTLESAATYIHHRHSVFKFPAQWLLPGDYHYGFLTSNSSNSDHFEKTAFTGSPELADYRKHAIMREAKKAKGQRMHGKRKAGLMDAQVATPLWAECQRTRPRQMTYVRTIKTLQDSWGLLSGRALTYLNKALHSIPSIQNNNANNLSWEKKKPRITKN